LFNESIIREPEDIEESNVALKKKAKKTMVVPPKKKKKKAPKKKTKLKVKPLKKPKPSGPSRAVMAAINEKLAVVVDTAPGQPAGNSVLDVAMVLNKIQLLFDQQWTLMETRFDEQDAILKSISKNVNVDFETTAVVNPVNTTNTSEQKPIDNVVRMIKNTENILNESFEGPHELPPCDVSAINDFTNIGENEPSANETFTSIVTEITTNQLTYHLLQSINHRHQETIA